jgi:hypothetical protein
LLVIGCMTTMKFMVYATGGTSVSRNALGTVRAASFCYRCSG